MLGMERSLLQKSIASERNSRSARCLTRICILVFVVIKRFVRINECGQDGAYFSGTDFYEPIQLV